jgi:hypothetical protein
MRGEIDFQQYSQVIGQGLFADNVILSIIEYKEKGVISIKEKEAIKRAKKFFDDVIDGEKLQRSIIRSARDINAARAYNSVQPIIVKLSQLNELRDAIDKIVKNKPIDEREIDQLDDFFSSLSRIKFQRAKTVLETV